MHKVQAARLRAALVDAGFAVPVSLSFELLAAAYAARDWQSLRASPRAVLLTGDLLNRALDARLRRAGHVLSPGTLDGLGHKLEAVALPDLHPYAAEMSAVLENGVSGNSLGQYLDLLRAGLHGGVA